MNLHTRGEAEPGPASAGICAEAAALLRSWLPANDDPTRPTATLATLDSDGGPDARTVLLTSFDDEGLSINTDAASRKVSQLERSPKAALCILLAGGARQLVVRGDTRRQTRAELDTAYARRSPYLQQLAWLNTPEFAALPAPQQRSRWARFRQEHAEGLNPSPAWTGYVIRPERLTFWSSAPDTASSRIEFTATPGGWTTAVLPG